MKYVLAYHDVGGMPESEAETAAVMAEWTSWFEQLGDSVVDGGNPFGPAKTISPGGAVADGGSLGGYSIISADSLDDAVAKAQGCPVLTGSGSVEVCETIDI